MKNFSSGLTKTNKYSAFTLIELLVVVAIIAILAAILFPVFGRARENARRSSCQSNLKQMGIMVAQYTQDYDERYPLTYYGASASGTSQSWVTFMQPYIKSTQVFSCPSESAATGNAPGAAFPVHYAYNLSIGGNGAIAYTMLASIASPASTVMMTDSGSLQAGTTNSTQAANTDPSLWPRRVATDKHTSWILVTPTSSNWSFTTVDYGAPAARHLGTTNILWADGHVKSQKVESFYPTGQTAPCLLIARGCFG